MTTHNDTSYRKLEDFAEIASDWFWESNVDHRFTYFSKRVENVLKIKSDELIGTRRDLLRGAQLQDPGWQTHLAHLKAHQPFKNFEYRIARPCDGSTLWLRISGRPIFDEDGQFAGYRGIGNDITHERETVAHLKASNATLAARNTELTDMRRALERSANEDSLTGLLNRRAFELDLAGALGVPDNDVILLHIDLDRFKWINDSMGHQAGDAVLVATAERLRQLASGIGPVYRVGGDEFQIIMADNGEIERARWMADAIIDAMITPICHAHRETSVGASIGIAFGKGKRISPGELVANADSALYEAKRAGRSCVRELTQDMQNAITARRQLASELPRAIDQLEIIPFYQPQVDARTGDVIGAEALARWNHPTLGLLGPAAFLDIAAEMGLVAAIDRSIMVQAIKFTDQLQATDLQLASISVNLSTGRLIDPNLAQEITDCWQDRRCRLSIELLETISFDEMHQETWITDNLARLRDIGVRIETDDFGSGRASITSLLNVRPDRVKIDRHLIQAAIKDPVQRKVVSAILEMTRALGVETLAEGVETEDDIAVIRKLGCDLFQGYAFARPLSEAQFRRYLRDNKPDTQPQMPTHARISRRA